MGEVDVGMATIQSMADENGRRRNFQLNVTKAQPLLLRKSRSFIQAAFFDVGKTSLLFDSKYQPPSSSTSPCTSDEALRQRAISASISLPFILHKA